MNHDDHVRLIARAFDTTGGVWADFGAGTGAFTLAIRDLAGPDCTIYAIDRDQPALRSLREKMDRRFPGTQLHTVEGDIRRPPELPPLDGIVAANALHYVDRRQQAATMRSWNSLLEPGGRIVLVEYDTNDASSWLPHPISFSQLGRLAREAGFPAPALLTTHPSRWGNRFYSASIAGYLRAST